MEHRAQRKKASAADFSTAAGNTVATEGGTKVDVLEKTRPRLKDARRTVQTRSFAENLRQKLRWQIKRRAHILFLLDLGWLGFMLDGGLKRLTDW